MNVRSFINRQLNKVITGAYGSGSFSQFGEDLIISQALSIIGVNISYLDIGAHHPSSLSNTYYFYRKGFSGTLVEPDPYLFRKLKKRNRDQVLNCGVGFGDSVEIAKLYILNARALNTFSFEEARRIEKTPNIKLSMK